MKDVFLPCNPTYQLILHNLSFSIFNVPLIFRLFQFHCILFLYFYVCFHTKYGFVCFFKNLFHMPTTIYIFFIISILIFSKMHFSWTHTRWLHPDSSILRSFLLSQLILVWQLTELNSFFLKHIFIVKPSHVLTQLRLLLITFMSAPCPTAGLPSTPYTTKLTLVR
ncbi:unnamed protein product [Trichobilharzia regenti]|nr:unnamed protein product [Trichobilharzia regenti]